MSQSASQTPTSMAHSNSQSGCVDPLDSMLDLSDYDNVNVKYSSPSISPSTTKARFGSVSAAPTTNNTMAPMGSQQPFSGPSHQYDMYKQQTPLPTGAIASTLAVNAQAMHTNNYGGYMSGMGNDEYDFGSGPRHQSYSGLPEMDVEYDSPGPDSAFFYPERNMSVSFDFINPNALGQEQVMPAPAVLPTQTSNVGRLWPGMHQQQAAIAKAQARQRQQQQLIQQQQQQNAMRQQPKQRRSTQITDPIVEEKISQLLNSMRQNPAPNPDDEMNAQNTLANVQRMRKEEDEMDEDEKLLASEEGKKLSSKERRQLRNKVSARAFRSRRKEYIAQLEGEINGKVNENMDLRNQNRALIAENQRLSDLTRMLLSSPSFSGFLDSLTANRNAIPGAQQPQQQQAPPMMEQPHQQPQNQQIRKDPNVYTPQQRQQHIGMTMIPEQAMDFSMLDLNGDGTYAYQPQVYAVLDLPEVGIDTTMLSGKTSNFVGEHLASDDEKLEVPAIEQAPIVKKEEAVVKEELPVDEEFDSDPSFALYADESSAPSENQAEVDFEPLFGEIRAEKVFARLELIVESESSSEVDDAAMLRVQKLCASLDATASRLEALASGL